MAKKYWWEDDEQQDNAQQEKGQRYWWDDDSTAADTAGTNITNRVNTWLKNHNTYISNYNKRYSGRKNSYEDAYVSDSSSWLDTVTKQKSAFDAEADSILAYMDRYKGYLDADWMEEVRKTLTEARDAQSQILDITTKDNEWWSGFGSEELVKQYGSAEEAYKYYQRDDGYRKKYDGQTYADLGKVLETLDDGEEKEWLTSYASSVDYNEKSTFDLDAGAKEVEGLKGILDQMDSVKNRISFIKNTPSYAPGMQANASQLSYYESELAKLEAQYGSYDSIKSQLSQKKAFLNTASRIQKGIELAAVADPTSANYDQAFGQYAKYAASDKMPLVPDYKDIVYGIINGDQDAKDGRTMATAWSKLSGSEKQRLDALQYMTEEEVALYNYYYNKHGYDAAEEYLDSIIDSLNYLHGQEMFGGMEGKTGTELLFGVAAGFDQANSGLQNLFNDKDYIPTSATQYASGMVREDLADNGPNLPDWMGGASLGQGVYDAVTTTANMAPSIMTSVALGTINPALGAAAGNVMMGASAAGNAYQEALNLGYDKGQARTYSTLIGASEVGLQYLLGGIGKLGGKLSGKAAVNLASKFDNAYARLAVKYGTNMLSEGGEEYLQEVLTPLFKNLALGTDEEIELISEEAIYSFLLGAITSGVMEGTGFSSENGKGLVGNLIDMSSKNKANIEAVNLYGGSTSELIQEGFASEAGSESHQFAEIMKRKTDKGKAMTGYEIRQQVQANEAQFAVEDYDAAVKTAKDRLTELGETNDVDKLAKLVAKKATGQELTRSEKKALVNSFGSQVAKEMRTASEQTATYKSLEDRVGTEGRFNVSESGQATIRESKEGFDISKAEVVTVGDGQVTFKTESGAEVYAGDIDFADEDQSYLVSAVSDIENITPAAATAVMHDIVDTSKPLGAQLNGIDEAYTYGYYGYSVADLKAGQYVSSLTDKQMMSAYKLGESARKISDTDADAPRVKMRTAAEAKLSKKEKAAQQKARFESDDVEVYYMDGKTVTKFDEHTGEYDDKRTAAINTAKFLSKMGIGSKYYFFESYVNAAGERVYKDANGNEVEAPNGMYEADGSIYIDLNAGDAGQGTALFTMGHELGHFVKAQSTKQFKVLGDLVTEAFDKTDMSMHDRVVAKQEFLSEKRGHHVTYAEAYEEVVCDALSTMLTDGSFHEKIMEIKVKDKGLFNTIKRFFEKMIAKFKKVYAELTPDQKDAQDIREMKDMFDRIQTAFAEALVEASDNFHAAMESVVEAKAEPVGADEIITDGAVVTDGEGERFSIRSMKHDIAEGKMFEDLKNVCGWTDAQVNTLRTQLKDLVEYMIPYRNILDMNESYGAEGRRFSPYKPNSDPLYKISMDFSTLCSKRLLTQYVIEQLQLRENRPMSAEEQMAIRDMLNEYRKVEKGLQVACAMCYVEAARLKSPKQIQRWLDDPAPLLKDYFGKKNKAFNDSVKKAQADFKESKGYDREAPKKDMKPADVKELNQIGPRMRSKYQLSAEEQAIVERAMSLPNSTYLTAGNLANLSETDPVIYDAYTAFVRTATRSKSLEKYEPYYYGDSARDNGNGIIVTDSFIEAVNRENGMRFSSWSDWRIQHLLDYITAVIDNSVRGAAMHGYTKFGDEVRVLGKTGMMFNMSGVAGTQTGLNEDGSLSFSPTESIDVNEAIQLREEFPEHAGLQCIGVSNEHIIALLRNDIIDYVIPYHVSGLNAALRRMVNIHGWADYTGTQHASIDKSIKLENAVDKEHWHEEPVFSEFFVGYDTGMTGIEAMRASAEKYKQMCKDRGLTPKFNQFATEDNYWKLLIDRKMINQRTGNLIRQKAVTPTFDFSTIKGVVDKFVENYDAGLEARALNHIVENWDSIPQRIKDLKKQGGTKAKQTKKAAATLANQTVAAQPKDTKYSYRGVNKDGIEVYETSQTVMNMSWKDRKAEYLNVMRNEYRGRTAKFERNGHVYYARFDQGSIRKHIFGDSRSSTDGVKALIKAGADGDVFDIVERSRYTGSQKNKKNHTKADYFDYFVKTVQIDGKVFDLVADVEKTYGVNDGYVYTLALVDNTTKKASPALGTPNAVPVNSAGNASTKTVAQPTQKVNKNSDRFSERTNAPVFYSQMGKVVEGMKQEKFGASSVISMLRGRGVKAEEIRWSGIQAFLDGKKSVTKTELLEFIKGSMLHIDEKMLDGTGERAKLPDNYRLEETANEMGDPMLNLYIDGELVDRFELMADDSIQSTGDSNIWAMDEADLTGQILSHYAGMSYDDAYGVPKETKWGGYKLDGGGNYRELLFKMPGSSYTNQAMQAHWGDDVTGVLAHARVQDFDSNGKKMLFIEEIQSDWHNAGHKHGYMDGTSSAQYEELKDRVEIARSAVSDAYTEYKKAEGEFIKLLRDFDMMAADAERWQQLTKDAMEKETKAKLAHEQARHEYAELSTELQKLGGKVPDAPFKDNYHEFVLKRLIRMAAEEGYDSIGWTTADIQSKRWSDEYAEGYRIEYDQDIPKFLKKYGKQWGATVEKTGEDYKYELAHLGPGPKDVTLRVNGRAVMSFKMSDKGWFVRADGKPGVFETENEILEFASYEYPNKDLIWKMDITTAMKKSVLEEGQALYSERTGDSVSNRSLLANAFEGITQNSNEYKQIQKYKGHIKELNELENKLQRLNNEIRKIRFGTTGPRDTARLRQLENEAKEVAKEINRHDMILLNLEASEPLRKVIERERKKEAQKTKDHVKEIQQNKKVRAEQTELRHKIRKAVRDLDKILNRGNKKLNVKEDVQGVVSKALKAADILFTENYGSYDMLRNGIGADLSDAEEALVATCTRMLKDLDKMPTDGYDNWQARQETENKLRTKMSKLKDVFARERKRLNNTTVSTILGELADAYASLEKSEQSYVQGAYTEAVHNFLKNLQSEVGGTVVQDMTKDQLESVYAAYKMVLTTVRKANELFNQNLKMSRAQLGNAVIEEVMKAGGTHGLWTKAEIARSQFDWNNMKPVWVANRIGSESFAKLMQGLFEGQYNFAKDIEEAKQFKLQMDKKYKPRNWDAEKQYKFVSSTGKEFSLNLQQIMSLYAFSKREQAYSHLLNGGFVFEGNSTVIVDEKGHKKTYIHNGATSYKLNEATLNGIINSLTAEQKAYVDEMQAYLSDVMGAKGNEVSMQLYGIKMFNERFYFPLRSSGAYMERAKEAELKKQQGQINLVNSGFTHSVKPEAKNPIILSGFMDVWAEHCNEMSMYHSMVLPMEDFRKVYNYSTVHDEKFESASVYQTIQDAYGNAATAYIDQLYRELNAGATVDPRETPFKARISKFKKAAVMMSASVVVQQFSAIGRAYALIDPKHFIGAKVNSDTKLSAAEEMKKYAPVAIIKEMGGFDTGTKGSAKSYIMAETYGKGERLQGLKKDEQYRSDLMGYLPAKADEKTWCAIWEAVKRETKAKHPKMDVKSEEFLKLAGERFSEVIEKTQVYDSVLARSANMRSKGAFMAMATAFMAEPTTTVNLIEDALRSGNKKQIARTFGAVGMSIVLNNALASIVYAMRDDDEDETFIEKYFQSFTSGMIDDFNPMSYYPFLKDVYSLFQGFDVERADMSVIADVRDAMKKVVSVIGKDTSEMDDAELAEHNKNVSGALMSLLDAGCSMFGVPFKNVRRDAKGIINAFVTASKDLTERDTTWLSFWDKVGAAAKDTIPVFAWTKDKAKADKLYDAIISGDKAYLARLKSAYKTDSAYQSAVRNALKENDTRIHEAAQARYEGRTEEYKRIFREIQKEGKFSFDDIMSAINSKESAIRNRLEPDKVTSQYGAGDFVESIVLGDARTAQAMRDDIIAAHVANGKTTEEAEEAFASAVASGIRDAYSSGLLDEAGAENMLIEYAGKEEEEATSKVGYWAFCEEYPDYADDFNESNVAKYKEFAEPANISVDVYAQYINGTKGLTEIKNEWGDVEVTKREQVLEVIDSLPLTWEQKDALYLAAGYSESKIWDVPW